MPGERGVPGFMRRRVCVYSWFLFFSVPLFDAYPLFLPGLAFVASAQGAPLTYPREFDSVCRFDVKGTLFGLQRVQRNQPLGISQLTQTFLG